MLGLSQRGLRCLELFERERRWKATQRVTITEITEWETGTPSLGGISGLHSYLEGLLGLTGPLFPGTQQWRSGYRYCQHWTLVPPQGAAAVQSPGWSRCTPPLGTPHRHSTPPQQAPWGRPSPLPAATGHRFMTKRKKISGVGLFQLPTTNNSIGLLPADPPAPQGCARGTEQSGGTFCPTIQHKPQYSDT